MVCAARHALKLREEDDAVRALKGSLEGCNAAATRSSLAPTNGFVPLNVARVVVLGARAAVEMRRLALRSSASSGMSAIALGLVLEPAEHFAIHRRNVLQAAMTPFTYLSRTRSSFAEASGTRPSLSRCESPNRRARATWFCAMSSTGCRVAPRTPAGVGSCSHARHHEHLVAMFLLRSAGSLCYACSRRWKSATESRTGLQLRGRSGIQVEVPTRRVVNVEVGTRMRIGKAPRVRVIGRERLART